MTTDNKIPIISTEVLDFLKLIFNIKIEDRIEKIIKLNGKEKIL